MVWIHTEQPLMPHRWIEKLNESNSRKHKEDVIEQALAAAKLGSADAKAFLQMAYYALNPFMVYNFKRPPATKGYADKDNPYDEFIALLEKLMVREVSGTAAEVDVEQMSYQFDSDVWNTLLAPVMKKDLRCGATIKTFNKILKDTQWEIPIFECQLATDSSKHPKYMKGRKILEPKLDGIRVLAMVEMSGSSRTPDRCTLYSRSGKPLKNFPQIAGEIEDLIGVFVDNAPWHDAHIKSFVLDGEIISNSFQDLMKQAHRKDDVQTEDAVYNIFDVIRLEEFKKGHWNATQRVRSLKFLEEVRHKVNNVAKSLQVVDHVKVNLDSPEGQSIMERYATEMIDKGYEGIMIKDVDAPYECKRTKHWLKWKPNITVDLEIVGLEEGTGRNKGRLGAIVCEGVDDGRKIKVNVGSGLSDEQRDDFWQLGKALHGFVVEVRADVVTQNQDGTYSLRFPRFVRFRGNAKGEKL